MSQSFRIEKDSMGEVQVPQDAYYAAQTQRAVDNFPCQRAASQSTTDCRPGLHQAGCGEGQW